MAKIGQLIRLWLIKFWIPLLITIVMVGVAISITAILLFKQQITVHIPNIPLREQRGVTSSKLSVLKEGEHLQILDKKYGWYQVRRQDESTGWVAGWLVERSRPVAKMSPLAEATVVLDPGHGGNDTGAISNNGKFEKTYTLRLARLVAKELRQQGARVIMTRNSDKIVYLAKIPLVSEKAHADMSISFHFDSAPEANVASGYTAYYYHKKNHSNTLAKAINDAMAPNINMPNKGVEFGNFLVIRDNKLPSVLLENGYINSDADFKRINSQPVQKQIAKDVAKGVKNYLETP